MKQAFIFAISALLLVQLTHASPLMKREAVDVAVHGSHGHHHSAQSSSSEEENDRAQLMIYTVGEIARLAKWLLDEGTVVVRNAVKELNEIPVKDELLQANITRMSAVVKEASRFDLNNDKEAILKLFTYLIDFATVMDDYENMPDESKLKITLKAALENSGYLKLESNFAKKLTEFAKNFGKAFGEYVKVLSPAEKVKEAKLLQWYNDFTAISDPEKKLAKFAELFDDDE